MSNSYDNLYIAVTTDDHYVVLLAALIKSIESNLSPNKKIILFVIEDGIKQKNKQKLLQSINPEITEIVWKPSAEIIAKMPSIPLDNSSYPLNIYLRLFIPDILPPSVKKVLYLDVDMIAEKDISPLFQIDVSGYCIAAVQDERVLSFKNSWGGILNYKELGLSGDYDYFNTGLLLMNIDQWQQENITQKVIECITANKKFAFYPDQYGLNVVLANKWKTLDSKWNRFATNAEIKEDTSIVHFVERKPMYESYKNNVYYQQAFYKYLQQTAWKNFKPISEQKRLQKKLNNIVSKYVLKLKKKFS